MRKRLIIFALSALALTVIGFLLLTSLPVYCLPRHFAFNFKITLTLLGAASVLTGGVALVFGKTVNDSCTVSTSIVSACMSLTAACGITSFLLYASTHIMSNPSRHPIRYPAGIIGSFLSFLIFIFLISAYLHFREKSPSVRGVLLDIGGALIYIPFLFFAINTVLLFFT